MFLDAFKDVYGGGAGSGGEDKYKSSRLFDLAENMDIPIIVVHHVKKAGHRTAKVFKLKTLRLAAGAQVTIEKKHPFKSVTVRRYHAGRHAVEILVNGRPRGMVEFDLEL